MKSNNEETVSKRTLQPWEPMRQTFVGNVSEVIQGGMGKSQAAHDQGDIFKPPGQG
jgi:hypothetical protein